MVDGPRRCTVSTSVYEGPFDLLLHLILKEQVDIYEVSLRASSTPTWPSSSSMQSLDLDVATEFLLIAATLVELKARRLLPGRDDIDLDEELALWEERDLLLARLLECKTFKDVAEVFSRLADDADRSFPRAVGPDERFADARARPAGGRQRRAACERAPSGRSRPSRCRVIDLFHVAPIRASVADAVAELIDELPRVGPHLVPPAHQRLVERLEVIVRFLALLELFKQGCVDLDQTERFGDIEVVWTGATTTSTRASILIDDYEG